MINKSKLWFLTLSGIIFVLAIYYVVLPQYETNMVFKSVNEAPKPEITISESEALTAMRVNKEEEFLNDTKGLQEILLSASSTVSEKNDAYEKIKDLSSKKSLEDKLEGIINKEFKVSSFVEIKENAIKVTVSNTQESYNLANNIISKVNETLESDNFVSVKFQ